MNNIKYTKKYNTFIFPLLMIICVTLITSIIFGYIFHEIEKNMINKIYLIGLQKK